MSALNEIRHSTIASPCHTPYENIPPELRALDQWVAWRPEPRPNGKLNKIPLDPKADHDENAAVNDRSTWGTFEQAVAYAAERPGYGLGFVLTADDPYTALDLDDCVNPETGAIEVSAWEIVEQLDSYTEISPSGRGLRILVRGTLPEGNRRSSGVEMYHQSHFVTLTGQHLKGTPTTVEPRQEQVEALYTDVFGGRWAEHVNVSGVGPAQRLEDEQIIELARRAANGTKFERLFDLGEISDYDGDESRADLALCGIHAFYTRDPEQLDRLFRRSARYREKWDQRHAADGRTYGEMTIDQALRGATGSYSGTGSTDRAGRPTTAGRASAAPGGMTLRVVKVWQQPEPKPRKYVIPDLVPTNAITILYGDGGQGKSYLAIYAAVCRAAGLPFLDRVVEHGSVLYLDAELDDNEFQRRANRVACGPGLQRLPAGLHYARLPGSLMKADVQDAVAQALDQLQPSLVVLDSLTVAAYGGDPLQAPDVTALMKVIESWGTVLALDHQAAPQQDRRVYRPFGSTFKFNLARSVIQLTRVEGGLVLEQTKHNFGPLLPPLGIVVNWEPGMVSFRLAGLDDVALQGAVASLPALGRVAAALARHPEGIEPVALAGELGMAAKTVRNHLSTLRKRGRADSDGHGVWRPTAAQSAA